MFVNWFLLVHKFCVWYYSMILWIKTATTITSMLITQSSNSTQRSQGGNSKMGDTQCVKVSVFGVILVRIFPHSDWIWRDTGWIQSKCGKIRTRITPNKDTFYTVTETWKEVNPLKMLLLNVTYQEAAYMEEKRRKIYDTFKTPSLSR